MRSMTPKEMAANELLRLLAPVLARHRGMSAQNREARFLAAIETLCGPLDEETTPVAPDKERGTNPEPQWTEGEGINV